MSEMLALPMVSDCIKRGDNIDDCGVSRTITSMSRLGCTHPPDNARFWGHLQPKDQARCSFQKPTELSLVPAATETVVCARWLVHQGEACGRNSINFPPDNNVTWRRWLFAIRAQRHRSAEATPPYGTCIITRWSAPGCY